MFAEWNVKSHYTQTHQKLWSSSGLNFRADLLYLHVWLTGRSQYSDNASLQYWRMLQGLTKSPGRSLHRHSHLALFNPLRPITWQLRTRAHYTPQQRSFASLFRQPMDHIKHLQRYFCPISIICWLGVKQRRTSNGCMTAYDMRRSSAESSIQLCDSLSISSRLVSDVG